MGRSELLGFGAHRWSTALHRIQGAKNSEPEKEKEPAEQESEADAEVENGEGENEATEENVGQGEDQADESGLERKEDDTQETMGRESSDAKENGEQDSTVVENEKQNEEMPKSRSIVLSGPSGCGKSTIIKKLMKEFPEKFGFSVSHTTRLPRPGEVHGKDYHFTTKEAMQKDIDVGEFIEHAVFNKNFYGTSIRAIQDVFDQGRTCILDIDRQGVISVKKTDLDCLLIFVKPPSIEELEERLRGRGTETEDSIQRRLNTSKEEFAYAEIPGSYDYILINDDLERAYEEFKSIIHKEVTKLG